MAKDTEAVKSPSTIEDLPESIAEVPAGQPLDQAADPKVTLESLRGLIREEMQSVKDTRIGKLGTKVDDLESTLAQYRGLVKDGMPEAQAEQKMLESRRLAELETALQALQPGKSQTVPSTGVGVTDWGGKQASILDNAGIKKDDPRITELLRTAESKQDFVTKLEEQSFAWKQADAKKPQPSPSTVASTIPSVVPTEGEFKDMSTESIGDKVIELAKNYTKNESVILAMNAEVARRDTQQG